MDSSEASKVTVGDPDLQAAAPVRPRLWNPNAAANWSLLLTPAFGAYLHAMNWRTLGKPEHARTNMVWVWMTVVILMINFATLFMPDSKTVDGLLRSAGLGLLVGWYVTQARSQMKYVKETI